MSVQPIVGICDTCHKGPQPVRAHGDLPRGPFDDVLMDAFQCESCAGVPVAKFVSMEPKFLTVEGAIAKAKLEILVDIEQGYVPSTVKSFSELHDYVDANCYGGLCDDDNILDIEEMNTVQTIVSGWLMGGRV